MHDSHAHADASLPDAQAELDAATRQRLARLASVPVDVAALAARIDQALEQADDGRRSGWRWRPRRLAAVAAAIAMAGSLVLVLLTAVERTTGPAIAGSIELSQLHAQLVEGRVTTAPAATIEQANALIARQSGEGALRLPGLGSLSGQGDLTVQSCCLASVRGKLVAAVLLDMEGRPVTLIVAQSADFTHPMGQSLTVAGRELFAHRLGELEMVMTRHGDRWLCVMGQVERARLADVAASVRF